MFSLPKFKSAKELNFKVTPNQEQTYPQIHKRNTQFVPHAPVSTSNSRDSYF